VLHAENKTLYAIVDLAIHPCTFDFMHTAVNADMARRANNLEELHFVFLLGPNESFRQQTPKDMALSQAEKLWRVRQILTPIAWMMPACKGVSTYLNRIEAAKEIAMLPPAIMFPNTYHINQPIGAFMLQQVVEIYNQVKDKGITPVVMQAQEGALHYVDRWIEANDIEPSKLVTLTVRQSRVEPARNSNIQSFTRFAKKLKQQGYYPVMLHDTDVASVAPPEYYKDDQAVPYLPGPVNLELRAALYQRAFASLSHNGAAAALNFFMPDTRYACFVPVDALPEVIKDEGMDGQKRLLGVGPGEQYEFSNPHQKYVWEKCTATNLEKAFSELMSSEKT